jgi:hypothetical protein
MLEKALSPTSCDEELPDRPNFASEQLCGHVHILKLRALYSCYDAEEFNL